MIVARFPELYDNGPVSEIVLYILSFRNGMIMAQFQK